MQSARSPLTLAKRRLATPLFAAEPPVNAGGGPEQTAGRRFRRALAAVLMYASVAGIYGWLFFATALPPVFWVGGYLLIAVGLLVDAPPRRTAAVRPCVMAIGGPATLLVLGASRLLGAARFRRGAEGADRTPPRPPLWLFILATPTVWIVPLQIGLLFAD